MWGLNFLTCKPPGQQILRKYITVGTNYQPSHQSSTSVSTCFIYTGDKHKTGSANYFATVATAASLISLNLFGSFTYFSLRCPTTRHTSLYLRSSGMLRSSDWYLVTDVSVPSPTVTRPKRTARSHLSRNRSLISHTSFTPRFPTLFANTLCAAVFFIAYKGVRHCDLNSGVQWK
jgi:hypothetical protein